MKYYLGDTRFGNELHFEQSNDTHSHLNMGTIECFQISLYIQLCLSKGQSDKGEIVCVFIRNYSAMSLCKFISVLLSTAEFEGIRGTKSR